MRIMGEFITSDQLAIALAIRKSVFIDEQGIDECVERDGNDQYSKHFVVYEDDIPVGTGRLLYKNGLYKIGRIAVLPDKRKFGYGDFIVRSLVDKGFFDGADKIYVGSQESVKKFYEAIGFVQCSEVYIEAGIPHIMMVIDPFTVKSPCGNH